MAKHKERKEPVRLCHECHEWYTRCNKIIIWVTQNPGHSYGWIQIIRIICTKCMPQERVRGMINRVTPYFGEARRMLPTRNMIKLAMKQNHKNHKKAA